jgi:hypothetical protein
VCVGGGGTDPGAFRHLGRVTPEAKQNGVIITCTSRNRSRFKVRPSSAIARPDCAKIRPRARVIIERIYPVRWGADRAGHGRSR